MSSTAGGDIVAAFPDNQQDLAALRVNGNRPRGGQDERAEDNFDQNQNHTSSVEEEGGQEQEAKEAIKMVECYGKGIKYSLLLANSIIFLSGAVVLALGIWTVSDRSFMERLLGINLYVASSVLLIVTGTIVAFISLLGSLGAYKEIKYMLKTYFVILLALLAIILTIGSLCFIFRAELDDRLQKEMHNSMRSYGNDSHVTEAWDSMQISFKCCGVNLKGMRGFESWKHESPRFSNNTAEGPVVPLSCCRSREDDQIKRACQGRQPKKEDTYFDGCYDRMKAVIKSHTIAIYLVAAFAIAFILCGLLLSGTLYFLIRKSANQDVVQ